MRVGIDGIIFSLQEGGGVSVYFAELLRFAQKLHNVELSVYMFEPLRASGSIAIAPQHRKLIATQRLCERYRRTPLRDRRLNVFHSSYYRLPDDDRIPSVVTVHDFAYERLRHGPALWIHRSQKWRAIRAAKVVICVSQATADDLQEFVGLRSDQSLKVIHNGVSDVFTPNPTVKVNRKQLLFVGMRAGYKNFRLALEALALSPTMNLLCVGGGPLRAHELSGFPSEVTSRVSHRGFVTNDELATLYRESLCLLYPSSFEGFGIPVVEAMRCGCPVVGLAACKAVVEVAGDALCRVDEADPVSLATAIQSLQQPERRSWTIARGLEIGAKYGWETTHAQTLCAYREAAQLDQL